MRAQYRVAVDNRQAIVLRSVLLVLVIPALIWDRDGRGLHDRLARAVQVRI
jgi:hypothetical protein